RWALPKGKHEVIEDRTVVDVVDIDLVVHIAQFHVGEDGDAPVGVNNASPLPHGKTLDRGVIIVEGKPDLLQVVLTFDASGGLANLLNSGQQQPDEDGDDGDHDQQFNQCEGGAPSRQRM